MEMKTFFDTFQGSLRLPVWSILEALDRVLLEPWGALGEVMEWSEKRGRTKGPAKVMRVFGGGGGSL